MLPDIDMEWPPAELGQEIDRVAQCAAWYGGLLDKLRPNDPNSGASSGSRWWPFGRVTNSGNRSGYTDTFPVHVPIAADVARTSADLLFSELPDFTITQDDVVDDALTGRLDEIVDIIGLEAKLVEAAELCAALSGMYWRVTFDMAAPSAPRVSWIQPDNAWPTWEWGELVAVTFVRTLPAVDGRNDTWRHLEQHGTRVEGGRRVAVVSHGLYVSNDSGKLGRRVPLTEHPDVADIAASLTGDGDEIVLPNVSVMTAGYVPNMRPNRVHRGSPLGRPDIEQLDGALRAIDMTWTSWMRDLRLGRARIIVPAEYLRANAPGEGAVFDEGREVYTPLNMMSPAGAQSGITVTQFGIRTAEHNATLTALIQQVVTSAGYSLRSFGLAGASGGDAVTATQVESEDSLSDVTREKKIRYWRPELRKLIAAMLSVDSILPGRAPQSVTEDMVGVEFAPESTPSMSSVAATANLLAQAQAASTETLVRMVHPDWSEVQVSDEVARITGARVDVVTDPLMLDGTLT